MAPVEAPGAAPQQEQEITRTILRKGTLAKRSINGRFGRWNRHYFVLDDQRALAYYGLKTGKLRGQFVLTEDSRVTIGSEQFGEQCFLVQTPYAKVLLRAEKKDIRDQWVNSLSVVIAEAKNQKSQRGRKNQLRQIKNKANQLKYPQKVAGNRNPRYKTHVFKAGGSTFEVDERYTLEKVIGQGAYGIVVAANDQVGKTQVAIKKIKGVFDNLIDGKRILREIQLLRFLNHKNISHVIDIMRPAPLTEADEANLAKGVVDSFQDVYIVLDKMDTDLHRVIYSEQQLSDMHVQFLMFQLLSALVYLESANVIHRDLKPSNVLVNSACELRVCDFGLARGVDDTPLDELTTYVVTRWYRAPELVLGCPKYTNAIDMWSIGCIFAELIIRKPLFAGEDFLHQLKLIIDVIGTPSEEDMQFMSEGSATRHLRSMDKRPKKSWREVPGLEEASDSALDLLDKLLTFSPRNRITAEEALKHDYLRTYHKQPVVKAKETFDIAAVERMQFDQEKLRIAVMEEIYRFRHSCYGWRKLSNAKSEINGEAKSEIVEKSEIKDF
uniref:Mitogen-activated protein kinase n=1 Tax=Aplanochytrium stocchinoi TaxID=215587 RepID=A0A7S3LLA7_9STRA|mmetsp:Transcript_20891/g.25338  ORF Transcript_20891/g.25338 Transcript_20891/m.25338 type:complete len:553 (+) Transcript_20891:28-1686(+)|eukprot:CAMPEP_0204827680 /NCGR_PEP_ID=MMETSP1346-20131115/5114_1 /ASSEMBLY_ACC=CAM_ASM_000771 /TAXON_ID=215587 /ORGANISM="Aplanochytrium stocchinoi, Strain GSBS06" /LENGTH=552 /DNA_ID=CAMNT_0051956195 /DNA_START=257 /DNA_END=1915 /DNA_ORIENTATION=+